MTPNIVLGIIGLPAAGKGTTAAYIAEHYGAAKLRFSDALKDTLDALNIEPTRDNLIILSEVLRKNFGEDVLAIAIKIGVSRSEAPLAVIDGVRREGDIETFKSLPAFRLLAISAEPRLRYERSKARDEKPEEATQTYEAFQALEQRSTEVSARKLMEQADITIENNGTIQELEQNIDALMQRLGVTRL